MWNLQHHPFGARGLWKHATKFMSKLTGLVGHINYIINRNAGRAKP